MEGLKTIPDAGAEHPNIEYRIFALKDALHLSDTDLEGNFETNEADEVVTEMVSNHYDAMVNNPEGLVGLGNNAFVFKQDPTEEKSTRCVKCRWDFLMVNNRSKKIEKLPANLQKLKRIEDYFTEIKRKTRAYAAKGIDTLPDNNALREAAVQSLASALLEAAGFPNGVPEVDFVIEMERSDSGDVKGDPYSASEKVHMILMDQVPGMTLQEMFYEASELLAERFDLDGFVSNLRKMVQILHDGGVTHRDLSIRNVMIDTETLQPRIIDFGKSVFSKHQSAEDVARDMQFVDEIAKLLKAFKERPRKALEMVKEMHKD